MRIVKSEPEKRHPKPLKRRRYEVHYASMPGGPWVLWSTNHTYFGALLDYYLTPAGVSGRRIADNGKDWRKRGVV